MGTLKNIELTQIEGADVVWAKEEMLDGQELDVIEWVNYNEMHERFECERTDSHLKSGNYDGELDIDDVQNQLDKWLKRYAESVKQDEIAV